MEANTKVVGAAVFPLEVTASAATLLHLEPWWSTGCVDEHPLVYGAESSDLTETMQPVLNLVLSCGPSVTCLVFVPCRLLLCTF